MSTDVISDADLEIVSKGSAELVRSALLYSKGDPIRAKTLLDAAGAVAEKLIQEASMRVAISNVLGTRR